MKYRALLQRMDIELLELTANGGVLRPAQVVEFLEQSSNKLGEQMSNKPNHRREENRRTEHGPRYENPDPGAGCNATHVARSRRKWKTRQRRAERRTGRTCPKFHRSGDGRPLLLEVVEDHVG